MNIVVGSTSVHKLEALREACKQLGWCDVEVVGVKATSGVNEHPYGFQETYVGALNRACDAKKQTAGDVYIGIESGVICVDGTKSVFIDLAVIVVLLPDGRQFAGLA